MKVHPADEILRKVGKTRKFGPGAHLPIKAGVARTDESSSRRSIHCEKARPANQRGSGVGLRQPQSLKPPLVINHTSSVRQLARAMSESAPFRGKLLRPFLPSATRLATFGIFRNCRIIKTPPTRLSATGQGGQ